MSSKSTRVILSFSCRLPNDPSPKDTLQVILTDEHLVVIDNHRHHVVDVPLSQITTVESDIYQHPMVLDKSLPSVTIRYAQRGIVRDPLKVKAVYNDLETLTLQTVKDSWDLPKILRRAIHNRITKMALGCSTAPFHLDSFRKCLKELILKAKTTHVLLSPILQPVLQSISHQVLYHKSAKEMLLKSEEVYSLLAALVTKSLDVLEAHLTGISGQQSKFNTFKITGNGSYSVRIPWVPPKLRRGQLKIPPNRPAPVHEESVAFAIQIGSLSLDILTSALIDNFSNMTDFSILFEGNDALSNILQGCLSRLRKLPDSSQSTQFHESVVSLASEWMRLPREANVTTLSSTNCRYLAQLCIELLSEWKLQPIDGESHEMGDKVLAYQANCLVSSLLECQWVREKDVRNVPEFKLILKNQENWAGQTDFWVSALIEPEIVSV